MKQSLQLGIGIALVILILAITNLQTEKKKINWSPTFSNTDKSPFGTYVLFNELNQWFPENDIIELSNTSYHKTFENNNQESTLIFTDSTTANLILISPSFNLSVEEEEKLIDFVEQGNTVFISSISYPHHFLNIIDSNLTLNYLNNRQSIHIQTLQVDSLIFPKGQFEYTFIDSFQSYKTYNSIIHNNKAHSSLMQINKGNGSFIIHNFPFALSNYYILNENDSYRAFATDILNILPHQKTYWINPPKLSSNNTTKGLMSVISEIPQLLSAWKILIIGLLIYIIFKAKREQRIIPIINELENDSKAYLKVISNLYYKEENYLNLTHKKMLYLFDQLKTTYYLDINHFTDHQLIINKTQSSKKDVDRLLVLINKCNHQQQISKNEFLEFCQLTDSILKS